MGSRPYKSGEKCVTGQRIHTILGQSSRASVYTTEDKHLRWEYFENRGSPPKRLTPAIEQFDSLMAEIKLLAGNAEYKRTLFERLGKSLFIAFNTKAGE